MAKTDCFNNVMDNVRYDKSGIYTPLAPHNYSQRLYKMLVKYNDEIRQSFAFGYIENKNERLKLLDIDIRGCAGHAEQKYAFKYNDLKLPAYNATVTDNWGYWNNKDYRKTNIENDFFGFRSSNEYYTKAEVLTEIQYPTEAMSSSTTNLMIIPKLRHRFPISRFWSRAARPAV